MPFHKHPRNKVLVDSIKSNRVALLSYGQGCFRHNNCFVCPETDCNAKTKGAYPLITRTGSKEPP